jgi:hypothetical protein
MTDMLYLGPDITEAAPQIVREGLIRRRLCWTEGCPCGAKVTRPNRAQRRAMKRDGGTWFTEIVHEPDCPAVHPATMAWARGQRP